MIEIQENYREYSAPKCALKSVRRLIQHTPQKYFSGIRLIHLTNTNALSRKLRRQKTKARKRKVALKDCAGWYVGKCNGEQAYIELLIDKIFDGYPGWALKLNFISDIALSRVFFHELGHHIHKTQSPEHIEKENAADKWRKRLSRRYFWKRYWYLLILLRPIKPVFDYLLKRYNEKKN